MPHACCGGRYHCMLLATGDTTKERWARTRVGIGAAGGWGPLEGGGDGAARAEEGEPGEAFPDDELLALSLKKCELCLPSLIRPRAPLAPSATEQPADTL